MERSTHATWRQSGLRDTVVALGVLLGLIGVLFALPFQPFQVPGYFLLIGFLPVEAVLEGAASGVRFYALFGLYLIALSILGSVAATIFRRRTRDPRVAGWRFGVAGGLAVTGGIALVFGVRTLVSGTQLTPALVGLATALVLLGLATAAAGLFGTPQTDEGVQ